MGNPRTDGKLKVEKDDIVVTPYRQSCDEAVADWKDQVKTLNSLQGNVSHGLFVAKQGKVWAVFLRKRKDPFNQA